MRLHSYLKSAETILQAYDGAVPFAGWLKEYFREHKKFGSRDRKIVSDLCYCFFRLGGSFQNKSVNERLLLAQFLCHQESAFTDELLPELKTHAKASFEEKMTTIGESEMDKIFPLAEELGNEIDPALFIRSHLIQPDLFLRVRPGSKEIVARKLAAASIGFSSEDDCLRLPITSKVDEIVDLDREAVVQDKSSQQVLNTLRQTWGRTKFTSWDCCAASGGKTILLHDLFPQAQLTVSDIRENILHNLRSRFKRAGIQHYQSLVVDVGANDFRFNRKFDLIICDAPCSGSGTWGRTPEQLVFFKKERIEYYATLQRRIAVNASKAVKEGGAFMYITCSVFKQENEAVVEHIVNNTALKLQSQEYIKGYSQKADTLFAALFFL